MSVQTVGWTLKGKIYHWTFNCKLRTSPHSTKLQMPQVITQQDEVMNGIRAGYQTDNLFSKVIKDLAQYPKFQMNDGLLYLKKDDGKRLLLCIPRTIYDSSRITE
jgi:hypothetical protein